MLKPVYALVGPDLFLQLESLAQIVRRAGDAQRMDVDGEDAELAAVLDELRTFSMFGSGKLVVVREAGPFITRYREQLEEFISKTSGQNGTLVLRVDSLPATQRIYKLIAKNGQVIDCKPPANLAAWAIKRSKEAHKAELLPDAAAELVDMIGDDLGRLDNELAKLALCSTSGKIDAKSVASMVSFQREQEMWEMTGELAMGHADAAVGRWRQLIQVDPSVEYRAITWLTMWLEEARMLIKNPSAAYSKLAWKYKGDRMRQFQKTVAALGAEGHARLTELLAKVDFQSKTGVGEMADNVERFLLTAAAQAPAGRA